ncbi:cytochrome P450 [Ancylothrix sp. C2]|uniref:cytochrome P450 n=1 Tax=Ancylothrix sp. D3o TaxID=2953691 RepID=UPI0021BA779D|nr:cytochrome P450 [Ancylothrix sp. D3o]MCT7952517.1 cytochrome P450 [Ancylothrix sp. D3o]
MKLPNRIETPSFIQKIQWVGDPLAYMNNAASRYPDIFTTQVSNVSPFVFINHPQGIQELFTADPKQFDTGRGNEILRPLVGDKSLFLMDGEKHRRERQLLMPPFHGERMRHYSQVICDVTNQATGRWKIGESFSVRDVMQEVTMGVILHAVFGLNEGERYYKIQKLLGEILDLLGSPLRSSLLFFDFLQKDLGSWSPWGHWLRKRRELDEFLEAEIEERRQNLDSQRNDVLTLLLQARDEAGEGMNNEELCDELMTLLAAGHETTATALSWALYWIHRHPEVEEKLRQEIDALGENPDPTAIFKLPYLSAVCSETLRIYPVAMLTFPRIVKSPFKLMGYEFDPGTVLFGCIYLVHHRPELYPEPHLFKPERFLERQFSPYEFLPFGGGNRRCLGLALAQFEMKLILATIVSRWQLGLANNQPVRPVRRGVTLAPAGGVEMVVKNERRRPLAELQLAGSL